VGRWVCGMPGQISSLLWYASNCNLGIISFFWLFYLVTELG
jgi:hypothetical protein